MRVIGTEDLDIGKEEGLLEAGAMIAWRTFLVIDARGCVPEGSAPHARGTANAMTAFTAVASADASATLKMGFGMEKSAINAILRIGEGRAEILANVSMVRATHPLWAMGRANVMKDGMEDTVMCVQGNTTAIIAQSAMEQTAVPGTAHVSSKVCATVTLGGKALSATKRVKAVAVALKFWGAKITPLALRILKRVFAPMSGLVITAKCRAQRAKTCLCVAATEIVLELI